MYFNSTYVKLNSKCLPLRGHGCFLGHFCGFLFGIFLPGSPGRRIFHDHDFSNVAVLAEVFFKALCRKKMNRVSFLSSKIVFWQILHFFQMRSAEKMALTADI
jgi:hypothetical protein